MKEERIYSKKSESFKPLILALDTWVMDYNANDWYTTLAMCRPVPLVAAELVGRHYTLL